MTSSMTLVCRNCGNDGHEENLVVAEMTPRSRGFLPAMKDGVLDEGYESTGYDEAHWEQSEFVNYECEGCGATAQTLEEFVVPKDAFPPADKGGEGSAVQTTFVARLRSILRWLRRARRVAH